MSKSNIYRRLKQQEATARLRYRKADDVTLLPIGRFVINGHRYQRVTAHLNRYLKQHVMKLARVNPKRIYRIMK